MRREVIAVTLLCGSACYGQESRASIVGRIADASGGVIIGAKVQATNAATNTGASTVTNTSGNYEIPYLLPGLYRIAVEMPGFKTAVRDAIGLRVSDRLTLDFTIELGDVSQSVIVTGETPLLDVATASLGIVMDERRISELPIPGGNPFYLSRLSPGVVTTAGHSAGNPMQYDIATGAVVNGTRSGSTEVTLDGVPNMFEGSAAFSPPQDLVQEFRIQTATFDASLGHAAGGVVNVSMKSGANTLHGTGYGFHSPYRTVPWFANRFLYDPTTGPITPEKREQVVPEWLHQRWGATLSGRVRLPGIYNGQNRTFWTFGYEGLYVHRKRTFTGTVPSLEQRRGDFSALLQAGSQYQIYDPATTETAAGGRFRRIPLPGNRIPASRLHPIAVKIVSFWPEPNRTGTPDGRQNYYRSRPEDNDNRSLIGRVDHNFHENHRMFWHLTNNQFDYKAQNMPTIAQGDITDQTGYGMVLDDVYVFNPRLLLNVRYGITYQNPRALRYSQGFDLLSLGFPSSLVDEIRGKNSPAGIAFPLVVVDGSAYTNLGADGGNSRSIYYQTFAGTVTKLSGGHSIRLGGEFRVLRENGYNFGNVSPRLEFSSLWTRGPLDNSAGAPIGQGLAALMLGTPSGGRIDVNASRAQQSTFTAFFVQDDWRVTSRLTFNLGLRYEYEGPTTERFNRSIRGFDFETANPIQERARANYARAAIPEVPVTSFRTVGGLTFAGAGGLPRPLWYPDRNNIAPRAGIVYQLTPKTAVRGGYGIFYDLLGIDRQDVNQGGFNQPTNLIPSLDNGLTFIATLGDPFPNGLDIPLGAAGGLRTFVGRGVTYFDQRPANARMQRWSVSIQRELPQRTLLQLAYVGNRGSKLDTQKQQDPIPRQYLSTLPVRDQATIDLLSQQVTNPFSGIPEFAGTGLAGVRTSRAQLLRPYPHFTSIAAALPLGNSSYHSLQVHAERRLSGGFTFQTSWTWSKFIEAQSFLNETDGRLERVISDQDFPHRFVMSVIWELPVGRGKPLLGRAGRMLDCLGGGWQLQGIYEGQSGQALGFGNALFFGNVRDIPLPLSERRAERWFNTEAGFERHPQRQPLYNIQTLSSRFSGVRSDGTNNFDLSMFKNFRLTERLKAQFRFESSNALNHVQFANPDTNPVSSAFGSITSDKGAGERRLTFAVKVMF